MCIETTNNIFTIWFPRNANSFLLTIARKQYTVFQSTKTPILLVQSRLFIKLKTASLIVSHIKDGQVCASIFYEEMTIESRTTSSNYNFHHANSWATTVEHIRNRGWLSHISEWEKESQLNLISSLRSQWGCDWEEGALYFHCNW